MFLGKPVHFCTTSFVSNMDTIYFLTAELHFFDMHHAIFVSSCHARNLELQIDCMLVVM